MKNIIESLKSFKKDALKKGKIASNELSYSEMIDEVYENKEVFLSSSGALVVFASAESTGRSPKDTYIVKNPSIEKNIDWTSATNIPLSVDTFDDLFLDAMDLLSKKNKLYKTKRVIGNDIKYAMPVEIISNKALPCIFAHNMFCKYPENIKESVFADSQFTILSLPYEKIDTKKYEGKLRKKENGETSDMIIAIDLERKLCLVFGSAYLGSIKKSMFTVMNYFLPEKEILPLHCSANEGDDGSSAVLLGLSGTGKTTLSADESRALIGDDEHGWSDDGVANFENGCYAKLIDLDKEKEPEIHRIAFEEKIDYRKNGVIIENAMMYPNRNFDLTDDRLTANSRTSYKITRLKNYKKGCKSGHPKTILFLTADANGVLPPVAKLNKNQAMLWFLLGYTSKLAGTETGIKEPQANFSRFFGGPFMPRKPMDYMQLLGKKIDKHDANAYLVNTGWSGGKYGTGKRMDINITRSIVNACLSDKLKNVDFYKDNLFHFSVPKKCDGVPSEILNPKNTWENKNLYDETAKKLANDFKKHFDQNYSNLGIDDDIYKECPK